MELLVELAPPTEHRSASAPEAAYSAFRSSVCCLELEAGSRGQPPRGEKPPRGEQPPRGEPPLREGTELWPLSAWRLTEEREREVNGSKRS